MVYYDEATTYKLPTTFTRVCCHMCVSSEFNLFRIFRLCKTLAYSRCWLHVYVCICVCHLRLVCFTFPDSAIPRPIRAVVYKCMFAHVRMLYMRVMYFISPECAITWPTCGQFYTCIFAHVRVLYARAVYCTLFDSTILCPTRAIVYTCKFACVRIVGTGMFVNVHVCKCACL